MVRQDAHHCSGAPQGVPASRSCLPRQCNGRTPWAQFHRGPAPWQAGSEWGHPTQATPPPPPRWQSLHFSYRLGSGHDLARLGENRSVRNRDRTGISASEGELTITDGINGGYFAGGYEYLGYTCAGGGTLFNKALDGLVTVSGGRFVK